MALIEQEAEDKEQEVFSNFINSIKSPITKKDYKFNIQRYLNFCNLTKLSELLAITEPQKQIIKYIMSLRQKGLSTNSIHAMVYAIYHFYEMNDSPVNKKRINMFIGEPTLKVVDRAYSHEEIQKV